MIPLLLIVAGFIIQSVFIISEEKEEMRKAVFLKGTASLLFVLLGVFLFSQHVTMYGDIIVKGLILGMIGDILLNLRYVVPEQKSSSVFALGIFAFLAGHFFYIGAMLSSGGSRIILPALIAAAVISVLSIPPLMKRITAPGKALKAFGYVYLVIVIAMFSAALSLLITSGATSKNIVLTVGALLFLVSDFFTIYYSFGRKIQIIRRLNLIAYYAGQVMIALTIML
ncbi:MAG: lysoplasmalogenase [Bullifex sp.]